MKKFLVIVCIIAVSLWVTACSKFECDGCHNEKTGKIYENKFGQKFCSECYEQSKQIEQELRDFGVELK